MRENRPPVLERLHGRLAEAKLGHTSYDNTFHLKCKQPAAFTGPFALNTNKTDWVAVHQGCPARRARASSQKAKEELRHQQPLRSSGNPALGKRLADIRKAKDKSGYVGKYPALRLHFRKSGRIHRVYLPCGLWSRALLPSKYAVLNKMIIKMEHIMN
jgi:hypothetical protein